MENLAVETVLPNEKGKTDKNQLEKVISLSEKSEKILSEFSEQLKTSKLSALTMMVSRGVPEEVLNALDNYQKCNSYFKRELMKHTAIQGDC